jgi:bile acid:Na+ symporter, BASS family
MNMTDFAHLAKLALSASILLLVIGLGMRATFAEAFSFFKRMFEPPHSLLRAIIAMNFIVPIAAATVAAAFSLHPAVRAAIVAMSISPVPPILPGKQLKFGGRESYVYGLLVAVSLAAIVFIPLSVEVLSKLFERDAHMGFAEIAKLIGKTVIAPVTVGIAMRQFVPALAEGLGPWVLRLGNILLIIGLLPVLIASLPGIWALIGNGTIFAILGVVLIAIAAGHWIGGPDRNDRTALGIVSAMRHPGVALAIGTTNFPDDKLVPAAILLFALLAAITTSVYGMRRLRNSASDAQTAV